MIAKSRSMQQRRDFQRKLDVTLRRLLPYLMGMMSMSAHLQPLQEKLE
jgi:hypothetical protein